jgi:hypothetical protein
MGLGREVRINMVVLLHYLPRLVPLGRYVTYLSDDFLPAHTKPPP